MSPKCTIVHGSNFDFYQEALDDDHVYLELDTTHFEAGYGRVRVPIPIHIWETIRHLGGAQLGLADKQDDELLATVESADCRDSQIRSDIRRSRRNQLVRQRGYIRTEER